jgi:hypothetical protein
MGVRLSLSGDKVKLRGPANAIAAITPELAEHKPEIVRHLRNVARVPEECVGALRSADGGFYLPWGPYLTPDDVSRMRAELVGMIEELANLECWPETYRDDVLSRAIRGPLADLLPNIAYFNERLSEARAEAAARAALDRRTWRGEGFDERRGAQ